MTEIPGVSTYCNKNDPDHPLVSADCPFNPADYPELHEVIIKALSKFTGIAPSDEGLLSKTRYLVGFILGTAHSLKEKYMKSGLLLSEESND
jgi:hypothetical protein